MIYHKWLHTAIRIAPFFFVSTILNRDSGGDCFDIHNYVCVGFCLHFSVIEVNIGIFTFFLQHKKGKRLSIFFSVHSRFLRNFAVKKYCVASLCVDSFLILCFCAFISNQNLIGVLLIIMPLACTLNNCHHVSQ